MAEVTTKVRTGEHLRKLFAILLSHPEELKASVALEVRYYPGTLGRDLPLPHLDNLAK
ncbi:hypothetical protein ABEG18_00520 [Alsobacter sp. KACC 23698]|uniref:Uncharacterized protein n=1 Tax=Alsobacter sp. KACC 23698 TaxID=3149229 RepID=A0AAU7JGP2_9HYPH